MGAGDPPGQPKAAGGVRLPAGLGPGEEGRTPLPTSTASGEAPPSTGVSGASSSRSVARLYSTICQTVGAPAQVRQIRLFARGPASGPQCPSRPGPLPPAARPLPFYRALGSGIPSTLAPPGRSPCSSSAEPHPDAACPSAPPSPGPSPQEPGAPTHVTAAAQLLQRDVHREVWAGGSLGLPGAGPGPGRGPGPAAARHHSRCAAPRSAAATPACPPRPAPPPPPPPAALRPEVGAVGEGRSAPGAQTSAPRSRGLPC